MPHTPLRAKILYMRFISHGIYFYQGVVPIMKVRRRRQQHREAFMRDSLTFLAPIAATGAMILLLFYG